jgi:LmbE family N-acetylglucosaminyl deacetylase
MTIVYLSPHLDDAVLSCGGAIRRQAAQGEPVLVITLITADVAPGTPLSPFAQRLHREWGSHPQPFSLRRAEDLAALTLLGARAMHLEYLDAIYRAGSDGAWMYTEGKLLFGPVRADDPLARENGGQLATALALLLESTALPQPPKQIYAPLAVGAHVDHQIVHAAARALLDRGYPVAFYEDYPYARTEGATALALQAAGARAWHMEAQPLEVVDLEAKVSALGYYRSQLPMLFGSGESMISQVWAFSASRRPAAGLAERTWWPQAPEPAAGPGAQEG